MSPIAMAIRYGGTGCSSANSKARPPATGVPSGVSASALITARNGVGTTMRARYVWRMPGLSCVGIQVRVRIAWPCEKR